MRYHEPKSRRLSWRSAGTPAHIGPVRQIEGAAICSRKRIPRSASSGVAGRSACRASPHMVLAAQLLPDDGGARSIGWHGVIAATWRA
jgi:hypothetical protein